MIKNLKSKIIICLFLLVTVFSVTSSCFAQTALAYSTEIKTCPVTLEQFMDSNAFKNAVAKSTVYSNFDLEKVSYICIYTPSFTHVGVTLDESYTCYFLFNENVNLLKQKSTGSQYFYFNYCDENKNIISVPYISVKYTSNSFSVLSSNSTGVDTLAFGSDESFAFTDISNLSVYTYEGDLWYEYVSPVDTSFDYSIEGTKRGQTKLSIYSLESSLRMYGYVGLNTTFNIGDTLDTTANINNLRLMATRTDNSDLYCYVYEGEEVNYYIVDENNVILDTGYISEMAKGYFLYGFEVNNGVDFVFLKDGQVYWDNNLAFKYSLNNNIIGDNNIVSAGSSTYIVSDKTVSNGKYIGYVYDSNNNLLNEASCKYSNNLSSLSIKVDTSYEEDNDFFDEGVWYINFIDLDGTNSDGTLIDFSDYYIRWSVPINIEIIEILDNNGKCEKRNGIFDSPSSIGYFTCFWSIRDYISKYKSDEYVAFDITLQVYDGNDNLVLTHIINSDDIVEDKIASEENNVDKGDYGILDNPNYTGGSSNSSSSAGNISNIQNWTADDYLNLMSTDNFVWEFFKAILGNLPWWITTPLTILIFGVVIITLIRFARGA